MQSYCIHQMFIFEPMKIFCLPLAIVILWLSCYPCSDGSMNNGGRQNEYSVADTSSHSDTLPQTDFCSLLCGCHCCHVHATLNTSLEFKHAVEIPDNYTAYAWDFKSMEISNILQPPIS